MNDQPDLPFVAHSETSRAAAESMEPAAGTLRAHVLGYIRETAEAGATDEQIQDGMELPANTERPRRRELQRAGLIRDSGQTRPTKSGRAAVVWVAK
jgi:hypothetical protein